MCQAEHARAGTVGDLPRKRRAWGGSHVATAGLLGLLLAVLPAAGTDEAAPVRLERSDAWGVSLLANFGRAARARLPLGDRDIDVAALPGTGPWLRPGQPVLPQRRVLVELPEGVQVTLSAQALREELVDLGPLSPLPRPQPSEDGLAWSEEAPPLAVADTGWARLEFVGHLRGRRVASVALTPVRLPTAGPARVARELRVELLFDGQPGVPRLDAARDGATFAPLYERLLVNPGAYAAGAPAAPSLTLAPRASLPPAWHLKLEVDTEGLYEVTAQDLRSAGVRPADVDPQRLQMTCLGQAVDILVEGEQDGHFDAGDRVLFHGFGASGPYTRTNAFWLTELPPAGTVGGGGGPPRMQLLDATPLPGDPPEPWFRDIARAATDLVYWQFLPDGDGQDHWFWTKTLAPATTGYALTVKNPIAGTGSVVVRAMLHGYTDTVQDPDHHTRVLLNGTQVDDRAWNGLVPFTHAAAAASALVLSGGNTVSVQQVADTGALVDGIYADAVEIEYDRNFAAVNNALAFDYAAAGPVTFGVFSLTQPEALALDVTDPVAPRLLTGAVAMPNGPAYKLTFSADPGAGRRYLVAAEAGLTAPLSIAQAQPSLPPPPQGADLVVLAPAAFWPALQPLVALREAQGLRVAHFDVPDVYDAYGSGLVDPSAIQRFARDAVESWPGVAPAYLLLVGEASYDYLDHLGTGVPNTAPTWLHQSLLSGEIPTDNLYACVAGDDPLPDLFVGRLPASDAGDVADVVDKIIDYETAPPPGAWTDEIVHVADFGSEFTSVLDALGALHVPAGYAVTPVYADAYGSGSATHTAIDAEFDAGCLIVTYLGHGAVKNWGSGLMQNSQVSALDNGRMLPFVVALNCLNGYYASPIDLHSLAEEFVAEPNGGALGFFAPSGLGFLFELEPIAAALYDRLLAGEPLGLAATGAKVEAFTFSGVLEDNLWQQHAFADPAGRLTGLP